MLRKFWDCFFYGDFEKYGKQRYHDYYAEIRSLVPPGQLLEYRVSSGWRPLCDYLGDPIPDIPFPRSNDTDSFVDRCRTQNRKQMMNVLFRALVVGVPVIATAISATVAYAHYVPKFAGKPSWSLIS